MVNNEKLMVKLISIGMNGRAFSWSREGVVAYGEDFTDEEKAAIEKVVADSLE